MFPPAVLRQHGDTRKEKEMRMTEIALSMAKMYPFNGYGKR